MQPVEARTRKASVGALFQGITNPDRNWIDAAVGRNATVSLLWSGLPIIDRLTVNENEFFNRSVGSVYYLRTPSPGNLPETAVRVDPRTGYLVDPAGRPLPTAYVLDAFEGGLPSASYLGVLSDAAEAGGAPADYVSWIRSRECRSTGL